MSVEDFMRGREKAFISRASVTPQWMKSPPQILQLSNGALSLYYKAWKGLGKASQRVRTKIEIDLYDAARTGLGYGKFPGDLEAVFKHIYIHNGGWTSDSGSNYCGPQISGALNLPDGITNFLNAVDKRGEALKSNYSDFADYVKQIALAKKNNRWDEIGDHVGNIEKTLWYSAPFLWVTSLTATDSLTAYHSRFTAWNDGFGLVHSFLKTFNDYNLGVGTTKPQAAAVAALSLVIKKFVPVLGDAYAKVFEALPGVIRWARGVRQEQDRQIRAILGPGNW